MPFTVRVLPSARRDLFLRVENLARHVTRASATRWLAGIYRSILSLEENPLRCALAEDATGDELELRVLHYGRKPNVYRILFSIHESVVSIHRVRHAAQDWLTEEDF
jgi:plasmid stabilization system protein ParE